MSLRNVKSETRFKNAKDLGEFISIIADPLEVDADVVTDTGTHFTKATLAEQVQSDGSVRYAVILSEIQNVV